MDKKNRKYSHEFKMEAIRLSEEGSRSIAEVASLLGIKPKKLTRWHARFGHQWEEGFSGNIIFGLEEDLRRLRQENSHLRVECAHMKKVLAFTTAVLESEYSEVGG